ncbi:MAG: MATE family efflux transporter [Spirochaetaceae bacterium]|nr:MATE family efflux transporter [Spirochaetaceae bacterium]
MMKPTETATAKNKMASVPIKSLMFSMGLPMILSMAVQAFYNIVDSYFVSQMPDAPGLTGAGEYGLNALALSFPVQMLMIAIGVGTGVGINSILSRSLGEGNRVKASRIAGNAIFLGVCTSAFFIAVGQFAIKAYLATQNAAPVSLQMGTEYLHICMTYSFGAILFMIYEKLLQGAGRTTASTIAQITGALLNIVLDPIMIYGLVGVPAMGIQGAAYATVIGQVASLAIGITFHHRRNKDIDASLRNLKPDKTIIKEIYAIGIPAILMQALMAFMNYGVNIMLSRLSDVVVTAYGVYYKIQQFVYFAAFGMNNALIPIVAYNYGMKDKKRTNDAIAYGLLYSVAIMTAGAIALQAFAHPIVNIFDLSGPTAGYSVLAIRIVTLGYLFAAANITFQGVFQALGNGVSSLNISILRLIVIPLPIVFLFSTHANAEQNVWWAFPIAEFAALIFAALMMKKRIQGTR